MGKTSVEGIRLYRLRDTLVMLDRDVANLFGKDTGPLNQAVSRNKERFDGFAFRTTKPEFDVIKKQVEAEGESWGASQKAPMVFTEHGVVMAATVLRSDEAIRASRDIVKVFVQVREQLILKDHGKNTPVRVRPNELSAMPGASSNEAARQIGGIFHEILDALAEERVTEQLKQHVGNVAQDTVTHVRARLNAANIKNKKQLAEIQRILAEADEIEQRAMNRSSEVYLAMQGKRMLLYAIAQRHIETGDFDTFIEHLFRFNEQEAL